MSPVRGVVLAGGSGSRLGALTKTTNKHLLPVGDRPMVYHPVQKLVEAGIVDILVVTGVHHFGALVAQLGSGAEFGCRFTYKVQDAALGIADALGHAEDFAHGGPVAVVLGDNVFSAPLRPHLDAWSREGALVLLHEVPDPGRYGVARFEGGRLVEVIEKPAHPPSNLVVTGIYLYDASVYDLIRTLEPSARGELEISEVNTAYIRRGAMAWRTLGGWWTDAGTLESLRRANLLVGTPDAR